MGQPARKVVAAQIETGCVTGSDGAVDVGVLAICVGDLGCMDLV